MSYQEQYDYNMRIYQKMLDGYEKAVSSPRYCEILSTMPFEFLNAKHLCDTLALYRKLDKKPRMYFYSVDEAVVLYRNLISFKSRSAKLLEDASYIAEVKHLADCLNSFVHESQYLGDTLCVSDNEEVFAIAESCLKEIPQYSSMLTKVFRYNYIESAISCLNTGDLEIMVSKKIIKAQDLDSIALTGQTKEYEEKIAFLCEILNHPQPTVATYNLKLKGVTFPNEDGSSRQENLKELQAYQESHPEEEIKLTAESYTYQPKIGAPEPAIKISWNGKCIGNVAKDVAAEVEERYTHPQCFAILDRLTGGKENMSYGCNIKFSIIAPGYAKATEELIRTDNNTFPSEQKEELER
jgi:hypothetical protein